MNWIRCFGNIPTRCILFLFFTICLNVIWKNLALLDQAENLHDQLSKIPEPLSEYDKNMAIKDYLNSIQHDAKKSPTSVDLTPKNSTFDGIEQVEVRSYGIEDINNIQTKDTVIILTTSLAKDIFNLKNLIDVIKSWLEKFQILLTIVHEDWTLKQMKDFQALLNSPVVFVKVRFWVPHFVQHKLRTVQMVRHFTGNLESKDGFHVHLHGLADEGKSWSKNQKNGAREKYKHGYNHMCRFWAMTFATLPYFKEFENYMRLDTDSQCGKMKLDLFDDFKKSGLKYMYGEYEVDGGEFTERLWIETLKFAKEKNVFADEWTWLKEQDETVKHYPKCDGVGKFGKGPEAPYTENGTLVLPCEYDLFRQVPIFYNNFEIASFDIFKNKRYVEYFTYLDDIGGIYNYRWGDAPIRYLGLSMTTNRDLDVGSAKHFCGHHH